MACLAGMGRAEGGAHIYPDDRPESHSATAIADAVRAHGAIAVAKVSGRKCKGVLHLFGGSSCPVQAACSLQWRALPSLDRHEPLTLTLRLGHTKG